MGTPDGATAKYDSKYLRRLAKVYVDIHELDGAAASKQWWREFLNDELRVLVRPLIAFEIVQRKKESRGNKDDKPKS